MQPFILLSNNSNKKKKFTGNSVQLFSRVRLFVTPWTAACQTSLSINNSQSLLKLMAIEMVGWHYQLNGHEFEQTPEVDDRQGSLVCCSPQGRKELDMTEQLYWTDLREGNLLK